MSQRALWDVCVCCAMRHVGHGIAKGIRDGTHICRCYKAAPAANVIAGEAQAAEWL